MVLIIIDNLTLYSLVFFIGFYGIEEGWVRRQSLPESSWRACGGANTGSRGVSPGANGQGWVKEGQWIMWPRARRVREVESCSSSSFTPSTGIDSSFSRWRGAGAPKGISAPVLHCRIPKLVNFWHYYSHSASQACATLLRVTSTTVAGAPLAAVLRAALAVNIIFHFYNIFFKMFEFNIFIFLLFIFIFKIKFFFNLINFSSTELSSLKSHITTLLSG